MKQVNSILIFLLCLTSASADDFRTAVAQFENPPKEARTKVWWFQGETETTRRGITADLEEFAEKGVGGVVLYDQVHGKAEKALKAMSPEWWNMVKFSALEAKRLGLTFEASLSNGYVGGGPWITEELAMQRLEVVSKVMPKADFDKFKANPAIADCAFLPELPRGRWCKEVAVVDIPYIPMPQPTVAAESDSCIVFRFPQPVKPKTLEYRIGGQGKAFVQVMNRPLRSDESDTYNGSFNGYLFEQQQEPGILECSNDGTHYLPVAYLHPRQSGGTWGLVSLALSALKKPWQYFRIRLSPKWRGKHRPTEFCFSPYSKSDLWEERVGLRSNYVHDRTLSKGYGGTPHSFYLLHNPLLNDETIPEPEYHQLSPDSVLVLRFYSTMTGGKTKHGRPGMNGLECDKLSRRAAEIQYNSYFKQIVDTVRTCGADILGLAIDSHEAGSQNWTQDFPEQFKRLRGYDMMPWLPAMAGYRLENLSGKPKEGAASTEDFMDDVRRTIADLVATEYFGALDSLCRRDGLLCTAQAAGNGQTLVSDNIRSKGMVQRPQGEFWAYQRDGAYDIKESASAAHLFNKKIASAEAYTDFDFSKPLGYLKPVMDHAYAMGLQEFVVCASAYQPWDRDTIPGSTGGGRQYAITRTNTQWNASRPFWDYQARCTAMMRLGENVTDLLVLLGNEAPMKLLTHRLPNIPQGTDFDVATDLAFLQTTREYKKIVLSKGAILSEKAKEKFNTFHSETLLPQIKSTTGKRLPFTDFHQRRLSDADILFIYNPTKTNWSDTLTFLTEYKNAQLWTPVDGRRYSLKKADTDSYEIRLRTGESAFIVFSDYEETLPLWNTERQYLVTALEPFDWTTSPAPETKHFSGTKTLTQELKLKKQKNRTYYLSCDSIGALAEVIVNGKEIGTLWCAPMELDITPALRNGKNKIELRVTNVNTNRLILDATLPKEQRQTYSYPEIAKPDDPLIPSGLLAPVIISTNK